MAILGEKIQLAHQEVEVIKCNKCNVLMVNIDADEIKSGDLTLLKQLHVRISNPDTKDPVCLECEIEERPSFREKVKDYFDNDDDNDSSLFSSGGFFGGSSGGFGGGFGGFGGGSFSGGGASRSF